MTSASRAPYTAALAAAAPRSPLVAILSDRPEAIAEAAQAAGMAADCADGETLWLLPYNTPRVLFIDLPVAGVSDRRLFLLVRQLCRACPDLVIVLRDPAGQAPSLPFDIKVEDHSDDGLLDAFAEARHLMQPVPTRRSLFYREPQKRYSLFR